MNQSDINRLNQSLSRIADSLEKIEKHLGGEKTKQKVVIQCSHCKGKGLYKYPFDNFETNCLTCSGSGQLITTI